MSFFPRNSDQQKGKVKFNIYKKLANGSNDCPTSNIPGADPLRTLQLFTTIRRRCMVYQHNNIKWTLFPKLFTLQSIHRIGEAVSGYGGRLDLQLIRQFLKGRHGMSTALDWYYYYPFNPCLSSVVSFPCRYVL